jgi:hypothetical protein
VEAVQPPAPCRFSLDYGVRRFMLSRSLTAAQSAAPREGGFMMMGEAIVIEREAKAGS